MDQYIVHMEWQKLRDEHEAASETYFQAFTAVNQKFAVFGQGSSSTNPTDEELSKFEETWQAWEDVKKRMDQFVKEYA